MWPDAHDNTSALGAWVCWWQVGLGVWRGQAVYYEWPGNFWWKQQCSRSFWKNNWLVSENTVHWWWHQLCLFVSARRLIYQQTCCQHFVDCWHCTVNVMLCCSGVCISCHITPKCFCDLKPTKKKGEKNPVQLHTRWHHETGTTGLASLGDARSGTTRWHPDWHHQVTSWLVLLGDITRRSPFGDITGLAPPLGDHHQTRLTRWHHQTGCTCALTTDLLLVCFWN